MKKATSVISSLITIILFCTFIFMAVIVISTQASDGEPKVFDHQLMTVLSGSMEPEFSTGSIIAVKELNMEEARNLGEGDVITFVNENESLVTHRIVERTEVTDQVLYTTKGDSNESVDMNPVFAENIRGVYSGFSIPYAGYIADYAQSTMGIVIMMIVPGVLLLIYAAMLIYSAIKEIDRRTKQQSVPQDDQQTESNISA